MSNLTITSLRDDPGLASEAKIRRKRPYVLNQGRADERSVVDVNTGRLDASGKPIYTQQQIHTNATLRKDEWISLDEEIIEAAREELSLIQDLLDKGLVKYVGGLGTTVSEWESASKMTAASVSMDGKSRNAEKDNQEFETQGVPIPVVKKPFEIGTRVLEASRRRGSGLDTTQHTEAAVQVARASEVMGFYGAGFGAVDSAGSRYQVHGLFTFPGRATANIADWANSATTPETILDDILALIDQMAREELHLGPFRIYIPPTMRFQFSRDFKAFGTITLRERVLAEGIIDDIKVSNVIQGGNVAMVELKKKVIDLGIGADLTTVQYSSLDGWSENFEVYAAWAPRLKQDFDEHCGIMHASV